MQNEISAIKYWQKASKQDFGTAQILYANKKYHHALFFCHLSIEKALKAVIIAKTKKAPPFVHDLLRLAEKSTLTLSEDVKGGLLEITTFNIQARYDDYKLSFYKKATRPFTLKYFNKTKEILEWLNEQV
jgi:HEPN domain-containing protein